MAKNSTLKDIANQLGVSKTLVSFVLNGKSKEKRISKEMANKVLDLAAKLNYKPNYLAKGLRTGKSMTLALIIADISNPFFAKFARHLEIEASKYDYKLIFANSDEQKDKFASELNFLKNGQVDGFILTPPIGSESELKALKKEKIPFVVLDRYFEKVKTNTVLIDNFQAGFDATQRMIDNGRSRIAIINTNKELHTMSQRVSGYKSALAFSGSESKPELIRHLPFNQDKSSIMEVINSIIDCKADGLIFTTSKLAILGIECLRELDIKIPEQISVLSFDEMDAYRLCYTPISAVVQPIEEMSKEALRILIQMIDQTTSTDKLENVMIDVDFIFRESCP
jgi:LacI family transcriptional regulator